MLKISKVFGITLNKGKFSDFMQEFIKVAKSKKSQYVLFMNSHMLHEFHTKMDFKAVVNEADYICPDGTPLLYSMNLLKSSNSERIAGNDVIFSMLSQAEIDELKVFFYGSTEKVLGKISDRLDKEYPKLKYKVYSPSFGEFDDQQLAEHSNLINDFGTNVLLVGLGCPKQEKRMYQMKGKVNALMLGVGGAFLLFAGIDSRAPKWMRDLSLEWAYRLTLEPRRLFKRYFITNSYFCWLFMNEVFKGKRS